MPQGQARGGLFGGVFGRGAAQIDDMAWLEALLAAEAGLARALERAGLAPAGTGAAVTYAAKPENFSIADLGELAAETGNPVPGLVRLLTRRVAAASTPDGATQERPEGMGQEAADWVHRGATSQDIMDTAVMLLARRTTSAVANDLRAAADAAAELADRHRGTLMIGRTLMQQAVPVTFGLVAAGWLDGLTEACAGVEAVQQTRLAVQFGGAAGTLAALGADGPRVARLVAAELNLNLATIPWHTQRLRILDVATSLARAAAVAGKIARDVTLLAQTEIAEVAEGQPGGSSAMPHKRNPAGAVAVLGCTRQVPGLLATIVASAEQEHQRAAGAWHAEWQPLGHLFTLVSSACNGIVTLLEGLDVDAARMAANLAAAQGLPLAEHVAAVLAGPLGARQARELVTRAAARAIGSRTPLRDVLLGMPELAEAGIAAAQVERALDPAGYLGATQQFIDAALAAHTPAGGTTNG